MPAAETSASNGRQRTEIARRGVMLVLSSPSGAGKGTLSRLVLDTDRGIDLSVSVTTRQRRPSEVNGVHYHFISIPEFESLRDRNGLLEWAEVHGNYYGTPLAPVERAIAAGRDVLFDIDWQGAAQLIDRMPDDVVTVFILPPSMTELRQRLQRRAEDATDVIEKRLKNSPREISEWKRFDYVIVNDDLDGAFADVTAILRAERLKRARRTGIPAFVETLLG
ncbi:guanylate kinase [Prosthecomicrobium sp. N25]|uniref:guanylate kinase n=1 Tax=Prosthecomicrobium sp. N25 TaxID=3129254 RepID=UPI0030783297